MSDFPKMMAKALRFAVRKHGDQRYGSRPYKFHLLAVQSVAFEHEVTDPDILISTLLHDTIEDTDATHEEVAAFFGERVANLVDAVSNVEFHPETGKKLKNRKQKALFTYPRIAACPGAVTLKLCDRVANVRMCWQEAVEKDRGKLGMYKREYGAFRKALRADEPEGPNIHLWSALDQMLYWEH